MKATTSFAEHGNGDALYRLRDRLEMRPRCVRCGAKLLLVRIRAGMGTCYRCDQYDPKHEMRLVNGEHEAKKKQKAASPPRRDGAKVGRRGLFPGPPAPNGPERIARMRDAAGLTQREVGEAIGVSEYAVGAWERGDNSPTVAALRAIERACEMERMAR